MKIEYHTFDVASWLLLKKQPTFVLRGFRQTSRCYTLTDPAKMSHSVTTGVSDGVRVPVFAMSTLSPQDQPTDVQGLTHGSLLLALGMENALRFLDSLQLKSKVSRAVIALATDCHDLGAGRYRAYFGITLEVE
jgi:hypothetical protein